jgi:hypothetical protein
LLLIFFIKNITRKFIKPLVSTEEECVVERRFATEFINGLETAKNLSVKVGKTKIKGIIFFVQELDNIKA